MHHKKSFQNNYTVCTVHCSGKIPYAKIIQEGADQRTDLPFISWLCYQFEILFYVCQRLRIYYERLTLNVMPETSVAEK